MRDWASGLTDRENGESNIQTETDRQRNAHICIYGICHLKYSELQVHIGHYKSYISSSQSIT